MQTHSQSRQVTNSRHVCRRKEAAMKSCCKLPKHKPEKQNRKYKRKKEKLIERPGTCRKEENDTTDARAGAEEGCFCKIIHCKGRKHACILGCARRNIHYCFKSVGFESLLLAKMYIYLLINTVILTFTFTCPHLAGKLYFNIYYLSKAAYN